MGGSSSTNAMAYVRGHRADYDRWVSAYGLPDWSFENVLPYFRRQETWEGGEDAYRGGAGPLTTRFSRYADPMVDAFIDAGRAAGHPTTPDYNGAQQEGFGRWQSTIHNGRRCSAADAYLRPSLSRGRIKVITGTLATRVIFEKSRAVGVEYTKGAERSIARAEREVILSAGVIGSPHLLMLSGIGDPEALSALGIPVRVALPGVGQNLHDHISSPVTYARRGTGPLHHHMRADRIIVALAQARFFGTGIASDLAAGAMAFLNSGIGSNLPDVQFLFVAAPMTAAPYLLRPYADGFTIRAVLLRPESRGRLELASTDPRRPPRIIPNFLTTERDVATLRAGLRLAREVGHQAPLQPFIEKEVSPGPDNWSDVALDAHIAATGITVHHPLGTCRMGATNDEHSVVDSDLRVRGVEGLRVIDASVMPDLIGGNINAAVIMIAEKASDLLRGKPPLAPAKGI
jgi:choline dehydrogenase/4-pyridoxate dehydrogenase